MKELTQEEMLEVVGGHHRGLFGDVRDRKPTRVSRPKHEGAHYHGPSRSGKTEHTKD